MRSEPTTKNGMMGCVNENVKSTASVDIPKTSSMEDFGIVDSLGFLLQFLSERNLNMLSISGEI